MLLRLQLTTHSFVVTKPVTFFERNRKNSVPGTLFCETRFTSVDVGGGLLPVIGLKWLPLLSLICEALALRVAGG